MIKLINKLEEEYTLEEIEMMHLILVSKILNNIKNDKQFIMYLTSIESSIKKDLNECENDTIDIVIYMYTKKIELIKNFIIHKLYCNNEYLTIINRLENLIKKQN